MLLSEHVVACSYHKSIIVALTITSTLPGATSVSVTWSHQLGAVALQSYEVLAEYLGPCTGASVPARTVTTANTSATVNSLEEYSLYSISVTALYVDQTNETQSTNVTTLSTS